MRMQANTHADVHDFHDVEHDYMAGCDERPKCVPVSSLDRGTLKKLREAVIARTGASSSYEPPPSHYATDGDIDPWAIWAAFKLDPWEAALIKYVLRAGKKPGESRLKDLKKARNYLAYLIEREEKRDG